MKCLKLLFWEHINISNYNKKGVGIDILYKINFQKQCLLNDKVIITHFIKYFTHQEDIITPRMT